MILRLLFMLLLLAQNSLIGFCQQKTDTLPLYQVSVIRRIANPAGGDEINASTWETFPTRAIVHLDGYRSAAKPVTRSRFGGWLKHRVDATGFFRTQKLVDRWWLVDPDGYLYINAAVNSVIQGSSDRNKTSFVSVYGNEASWVERTKDLLFTHGFNGLGAWSDVAAFSRSATRTKKPIAYTMVWNFMSGYGKKKGVVHTQPGHAGYLYDAVPVFDPDLNSTATNRQRSWLSTKTTRIY